MQDSDREQKGQKPRARFFKIRYIFIIIFICMIVPFAAVGLSDLYKNILEHNPPKIELIDVPRGIGLSPVNVRLRVSDFGAGLDEIIVRLRMKGPAKELKRIEAKGKESEEIVLDFSSEDPDLTEGTVVLEVRAFDRSFWNNSAEMSLPLRVDFRKPKIEVVSTQNNARLGGSQMVFYKAIDEDLAISGVKVGGKIFLGTPATGVDKELNEKNLHVAIYAVDFNLDKESLSDSKQSDIKLFAEDKVGNAVSSQFYNKVLSRDFRSVKVNLDDDFMRTKVVDLSAKARSKIKIDNAEVDLDENKLLNDFKIVNEKLRLLNETEISSLTSKSPRLERFFESPFVRQSSSVQISYGDRITYFYEGKEIGKSRSLGEELVLPRGNNEVLSANAGIVIFAQDVGIYGWTVGIDHGMGLVSVYSRLSKANVSAGVTVEKGQVIGTIGRTGMALKDQFNFEMHVQGVPVDPREWLDTNWYYTQIVGKINEAKKILGIPVYVPLR